MHSSNKRRGVSLVELLIAIGVLAVGLSGVAASLYYGHAKSKHGDDLARAAQYSRMLIEIATSRNFVDTAVPIGDDGLPTPESGVNDSSTEPPRELVAAPYTPKDFIGYWSDSEADRDDTQRELLRYKRNIRMERVGTEDTPEENLVRVHVTVYWEKKKEGGKNSVSTSAIVHTNNPIPD